MTVARSVGDVLSEHVVFEVDCIDRMYVNVYVPGLQYAPGLVGYVQRQLGLPIASTAPLARITDAFSTAVHRFARTNAVPLGRLREGPAQGRCHARAPGAVQRHRGGAVHRAGIVKLLTLFGGCEDWSLWRLRRGTSVTSGRRRHGE